MQVLQIRISLVDRNLKFDVESLSREDAVEQEIMIAEAITQMIHGQLEMIGNDLGIDTEVTDE